MYKAFSTPCQEMLCNGPETASIYLNIPKVNDEIELFRALCNITNAIEEGLEKESIIGKAVSEKSHLTFLNNFNWYKLFYCKKHLNILYNIINIFR